jgi:hypothetical protein
VSCAGGEKLHACMHPDENLGNRGRGMRSLPQVCIRTIATRTFHTNWIIILGNRPVPSRRAREAPQSSESTSDEDEAEGGRQTDEPDETDNSDADGPDETDYADRPDETEDAAE